MEYPEDEYLLLSGIQHFTFCRRQWALIHIEQQWEENLKTVEGEILHKHAHDYKFAEKRKNVIIIRGMPVFSRTMGVSGSCDIVEFVRDERDGIEISGHQGKYRAEPVEYKRGRPKKGKEDVLQLVAESMCLEEMLCCSIPKGFLYYGEIRHRTEVDITEELRLQVRNTFQEMHSCYDRRYTPKGIYKKRCEACSLKDICLPKASGKVSDYLHNRLWKETT